MSSIKTYYRLVKPGIVRGNAIAALAVFLYAEKPLFEPVLIFGMLVGLSLAIAGACVVNNVLDRDIDARMERTRNRALPTGDVSVPHALLYAAILFILGFGCLLLYANVLAALITFVGVVVYVGLYTPAKRWTVHSTLIGAIAGAVPPLVGYAAARNSLDLTAVTLFLILVTWQMVHFYAIAIFRREDYAAAGLPVVSVSRSAKAAKTLMVVYAVLFAGAVYALYRVAHLGLLYLIVMSTVSFGWLAFALAGFRTQTDERWAKRMFFYSLIALLLFCATLALS